jgi:agmatinase
MPFDPNAAAAPDAGVFGLPHTPEEAGVVLIPVPFDATTSYRKGAADGPAAIFEASKQVDLLDLETGKPYEPGIAMLEPHVDVARWNAEARDLGQRVIDVGGDLGGDPALEAALARVNEISARVDQVVYEEAERWLDAGKIVGLVGGDHAVPFGTIRAHAERWPGLGVLHFDAHADLRVAYEGFARSHASIMHNVLADLPAVAKLVQVGVRDLCEQELDAIVGSNGRVTTFFDVDLARARRDGEPFTAVAARIAEALPKQVYVSFDIDGLDPALCPNTGTPVPGGLRFDEATAVLEAVVKSGRTIVGFDLNEVAPGGDDDEWDANVGARMLYKLIGWTLVSQGKSTPPRR